MSIGMTVDGLISGMSTTSLIDQLIKAEAHGQRALKTRLSSVEKAAAAYRSINTKMDALRTAAEKLTSVGGWKQTAATSSATSVTATAASGTQPGALTFNVVSTAATHSVASASTWSATTDPSGYGGSLTVLNGDGTTRGTITIGGTGTLADTARAINDSAMGLTAAAVQVSPGQYRLQVTSKDSGQAAAFSLGDPGDFAVTTQGADAHLRVGTGPGAYDVYSKTNEFAGLMPGVTLNVTKPETGVTVTVASDPAKIADNVQALVDAANAALSEIKKHAATGKDAKGALSGDATMNRLADQVLTAVYSLVGSDGSPGAYGVELTRDGTVKFTKDTFLTAYQNDPDKAERLLVGTRASAGPDGVSGNGDDIAAVPGVAQRLQDLAKATTNSVDGTLTLLAQGKDKLADDLEDKIEGWDVRLDKRRLALVRQFSAMETALGSMQSQASWLAGQINSLPRLS